LSLPSQFSPREHSPNTSSGSLCTVVRSAPLGSVFFLIPVMSGSTPPVKGATSICVLGEGSTAAVYSRGQSRAIHEPPGSHLAVFLEIATLALGRRQRPHCQRPQIREAFPPRQTSELKRPPTKCGIGILTSASVGAGTWKVGLPAPHAGPQHPGVPHLRVHLLTQLLV